MISLLHISQKENPTFLEAGLSLSLCILSKIIKQASKLETHLTNLTRELKQTLIEVLAGLPGRDDMLEPHVVVRQSSAAIDSTKYTKEFVQ